MYDQQKAEFPKSSNSNWARLAGPKVILELNFVERNLMIIDNNLLSRFVMRLII